MRLLVTGAAGFIGSHLSERLVADGHDVVGVDCFTDYYERARKLANLAALRDHGSFDLREVDLVEADLAPLLDGIDGIFHLAAQPGVRGSWGARFDVYVRNNLMGTQRLLEALKDTPVPVVYASSSSVYGDVASLPISERELPRPISPYGVTKLAAEQLAGLYHAAYGLPVVSLRYFTVYGPRQRPDMAFTKFVEAALRSEAVEVFGDGDQTRDFTFVADAVDATVRALGGSRGSYNVGGGTRATINEAIAIIEELTGEPLKVERAAAVRGDMPHTWADTTAIRATFGWAPRATLYEGLAEHVRWARAALSA